MRLSKARLKQIRERESYSTDNPVPDLLAYVEFLEKALGDATGHLILWIGPITTNHRPGVLTVHKSVASNALGVIGDGGSMPELAEWLEEKE
jgi:hypothetical protein